MRRSSTCRWWFALAVLTASPVALAQAPSSSAQAQSLFDGGRALMEAGKLAEACAAFESSQKLEPRATTLLNLASCREKNDQLATARTLFAEAGRLARATQKDKLVDVALNHLRKLEPRVSKLTITVTPDHAIAGLEVLRNGEKVDATAWNRAQFVDGGSYTITARAPGRTAWTVTRQIQLEHDVVQIEVPKLVDPTAPVAAASPPPAAPPPVATTDPHAAVAVESPAPPPPPAPVAPPPALERPVPSYTAPILVGAGALALAGVGIYFEVDSHSTHDDAVRMHSSSLNDTASHQRITGEVLDVAALAAAGVAVYLGIRTHRERQSETIAVAPLAGPALAGVALSGHW